MNLARDELDKPVTLFKNQQASKLAFFFCAVHILILIPQPTEVIYITIRHATAKKLRTECIARVRKEKYNNLTEIAEMVTSFQRH